MDMKDFFQKPSSLAQKQFEALRYYYVEDAAAAEAAENSVIVAFGSVLKI